MNKRKNLWIHAPTWVHLTDIMLSEKETRHKQENIVWLLFHEVLKQAKFFHGRNQNKWSEGLAWKGARGDFWGWWKYSVLICVVITPIYIFVKTCWTIQLNWMFYFGQIILQLKGRKHLSITCLIFLMTSFLGSLGCRDHLYPGNWDGLWRVHSGQHTPPCNHRYQGEQWTAPHWAEGLQGTMGGEP